MRRGPGAGASPTGGVAAARGPQTERSMLEPQLGQAMSASSDMRAIVEWAPQSGQSERNSNRLRQKTHR